MFFSVYGTRAREPVTRTKQRRIWKGFSEVRIKDSLRTAPELGEILLDLGRWLEERTDQGDDLSSFEELAEGPFLELGDYLPRCHAHDAAHLPQLCQ